MILDIVNHKIHIFNTVPAAYFSRMRMSLPYAYVFTVCVCLYRMRMSLPYAYVFTVCVFARMCAYAHAYVYACAWDVQTNLEHMWKIRILALYGYGYSQTRFVKNTLRARCNLAKMIVILKLSNSHLNIGIYMYSSKCNIKRKTKKK